MPREIPGRSDAVIGAIGRGARRSRAQLEGRHQMWQSWSKYPIAGRDCGDALRPGAPVRRAHRRYLFRHGNDLTPLKRREGGALAERQTSLATEAACRRTEKRAGVAIGGRCLNIRRRQMPVAPSSHLHRCNGAGRGRGGAAFQHRDARSQRLGTIAVLLAASRTSSTLSVVAARARV